MHSVGYYTVIILGRRQQRGEQFARVHAFKINMASGMKQSLGVKIAKGY